MSDFFDEGYKLPVSNNYFKFKPNDNKFRILSRPIVGYEWWEGDGTERKPKRVHTVDEIPENVRIDKSYTLKHFWAMIAYNYSDEKVQILEITQKTIQKAIESLVSDEDWGAPFSYDITVKKTGEGLDTEYQVSPKPKKEVDPEILTSYKAMNINLEALYDGSDPFVPNTNEKLDPEQNVSDEDMSKVLSA